MPSGWSFSGTKSDRIVRLKALLGQKSLVVNRSFPSHSLRDQWWPYGSSHCPGIQADLEEQLRVLKKKAALGSPAPETTDQYDDEMQWATHQWGRKLLSPHMRMDRWRRNSHPPFLTSSRRYYSHHVDESHMTWDKSRACTMETARKECWSAYNRLPSAYRSPLRREEFGHVHQIVYVSATPGDWSGASRYHHRANHSSKQVARSGWSDASDYGTNGRSLGESMHVWERVTDPLSPMTKDGEDLTDYFKKWASRSIHALSDIKTERTEIIRDLRLVSLMYCRYQSSSGR